MIRDNWYDNNFNSIKVRLELADLRKYAKQFGDFNSIKVRLEHFEVDLTEPYAEFQFHKGTIRTLCGCHGKGSLHHFNSIKVRLELKGITINLVF